MPKAKKKGHIRTYDTEKEEVQAGKAEKPGWEGCSVDQGQG